MHLQISYTLNNTAARINHLAEQNTVSQLMLHIIAKLLEEKASPPVEELAILKKLCAEYFNKKEKTAIEKEACYLYALCLLEGLGMQQDILLALKLFTKIVKCHPHASYHLAATYLVGLEGLENSEHVSLAGYYFALGKNKWDPWMLFVIGSYYLRDQKIATGKAVAFTCFSLAANLGHFDSQFKLAECFQEGHGTEVDTHKALAIYKKLSISDNQALCRMAEIYFSEASKKEIDAQTSEKHNKMGVECYAAAANRDDIVALCNYAWCYELGKGVAKDLRKAARLFLHVLHKKSPAFQTACQALTRITRALKTGFDSNGNAVKKDLEVVFEVYAKLTELGNLKAQFQLALLYFHGEGVAQDREKASIYLSSLPAKDFPEAKKYLAACRPEVVVTGPFSAATAFPMLQLLEARSTMASTGTSSATNRTAFNFSFMQASATPRPVGPCTAQTTQFYSAVSAYMPPPASRDIKTPADKPSLLKEITHIANIAPTLTQAQHALKDVSMKAVSETPTAPTKPSQNGTSRLIHNESASVTKPAKATRKLFA